MIISCLFYPHFILYFSCVFCLMTFVIYIVTHVSANRSPCDQLSIYILFYFTLCYYRLHELMEIKRMQIKSNPIAMQYKILICFT